MRFLVRMLLCGYNYIEGRRGERVLNRMVVCVAFRIS